MIIDFPKWVRMVACPHCKAKRTVEIGQTKCKCKSCNTWFKVDK